MKTLNILLEITVYSGILFCAILLLKLCVKNKMSPFLHLAVWGLLIARLLIPVTLESSIRLFVIPAETINETAQEQAQPSVISPDATTDTNTDNAIRSQPQTEQMQSATIPAATSTNKLYLVLSTEEIILAIWLTGTGIGLIYLAVLFSVLRRRIRRNAEPSSKRLLALFSEVKAELNIKRNVKIICQCEYGTPAIMFPKTVLMPIGALVSMNDEQAKFVLRHELMHFKRGDHIMSLALSLLNAIYWFNPIVWIAFKQIHADMETACDSDVVRDFSSDEKGVYAAIILSLFSKKQYGNLALGMARGNTRQIAEKRIRGVFMNHKTNRKVKITAVLLTSLLLFTCFTTACQPTPENEVVVYKGGDTLANEINATPVPKEKYQAPAQYKQGTQTFYDSMLSVSFDMQVETPDVSAYPVYTVQDANLTQQQVDRIVSVLMQGQPLQYFDERETKQEITDRYLLPAKKRLSESKSGKVFSDDGGNKSIEELQEIVEIYEGWISSAPESREEQGITAEEYTASGALLAMANLGKSSPATLKITRTGQSFSDLQFINGTEYIYNGFWEPADELPLKTTKEQAVAMATQLVADMGAEEFKLAAVGKTTRLGSSEFEIDSDEYQATMAYSVVFTRTVDDIPLTYTPIDSVSFSEKDDKMDAEMWSYERIMINIDDDGIANLFWNGNLQIGDCVNENVQLMKFEDIAIHAMDQIKMQSAFLTDQNKEGDGIYTKCLEFDINKAKLGFARIRVKDSAEYQIVPVWDFYGIAAYHREEDDVAAFNETTGADLQATEISDYGYRAIVTINAIDGSVINRDLGY